MILPVITAPFTAAVAVLNGVWETIKAAVAAAFLVWTSAAHGTPAGIALAGAAAVALVLAVLSNAAAREGWAFGLMAATIAFAVLSLFLSLFPNVMPASNDPAFSLTIVNASSSEYTLSIMSWVALVFLPLILGYQAWTYWIFRKRVTRAHIGEPTTAGDAGAQPEGAH